MNRKQSPAIIDTIRFFEYGKPAPSNSVFKGIVTAEKLFGGNQTGGYFGYTGRPEATESEFKDQLSVTNSGFIDYTSREKATEGSTFSSIGVLNKDKTEEFKQLCKQAFSKKGDLAWDIVISLDSFDTAYKHNLHHQPDYAAVISKVLPQFFLKVGLDPDNMLWWMDYHRNTEHPHMHICFLEKIHTRTKGKFTSKQLEELKRIIIKEVTARETYFELTGTKYYEGFRQKDLERNELLERIRSIDFDSIDSIIELSKVLPETGRLQYNSANIAPFKDQIDRITDSFLERPEIKPIFESYMERLIQFDLVMNNDAGKDVATLKKAETKKLYASIGNLILRVIKESEDLSKAVSDSDRYEDIKDETEELTKSVGSDFKSVLRYQILKQMILESETNVDYAERWNVMEQVYNGLQELLQETDNSTLKPCIFHRLARMEYDGLGVERNLEFAYIHCRSAIQNGSKYSYTLLSRICFEKNDAYQALSTLLEGSTSGDPVSMYLLGKNLIEGNRIYQDKTEGLEYIRKSAERGYLPAKQYLNKHDREHFINGLAHKSIMDFLSSKIHGIGKNGSAGAEISGYINDDDSLRIKPESNTDAEIDAYLNNRKTIARRGR